MIKKTTRGWEVIGHKSNRSFGIYDTKVEAQARLHQIERFKYGFLKNKK